MRNDDGAVAALLQSFEPFENARLDERGADGAFDEDEAVADGGGEEALGAQQRDAHAGDGEQSHDQHRGERNNKEGREQQADDELEERERDGDPFRCVSRLGEPVALGDVRRQRPGECTEAPRDQLAVGGG